MHQARLPVAAALLAVCLGTAAHAATVVENGDRPASGRRTQPLRELWRIGGPDDQENLLGVVRKVLADEQGNVYLLDAQLVEVQVYDTEGNFLKTLGKEGDGPGELRNAWDEILLPDRTLGLVQSFPGRIVKVDRDGLPAGEMHPGGDPAEGGIFSVRKAMAAGPHLVISCMESMREEGSRTNRLSIGAYRPDGTLATEYCSFDHTFEVPLADRVEADMYFPNNWTLSADGRVWIPPHRNRYSIDVYLPDGTLERTITRRYESLPRSGEETGIARAWMTPRSRRNRRAWNVVVEPTVRDIMDMHVDTTGRLWVLSSRGAHPQEPGIHSVWDVFDPEGRFAEEVAMACEGEAIRDEMFFPAEGMVVLVKESLAANAAFRGLSLAEEDDGGGEARPIEVICYEMTP